MYKLVRINGTIVHLLVLYALCTRRFKAADHSHGVFDSYSGCFSADTEQASDSRGTVDTSVQMCGSSVSRDTYYRD